MTPSDLTACLIYCRVSTREQRDSRHGLDGQEDVCRAEAQRRGWRVVDVIHETISGDKARRPLFQQAITRCREEGLVLLAAESSRLTRRKGGVSALLEQAHREGWACVAMDMPQLDVTSPMGEFIADILSSVNRLARRQTGERTSRSLRAKVARGEPVGRPRALDATLPDGSPDLATRERAQATINQLHALRAEGLSLERIAGELNARGVKGLQGGNWHKRSVHLALKRYGKVEVLG